MSEVKMRLRSVLRGSNYRMEGLSGDDGSNASLDYFGTIPVAALATQAAAAQRLADASEGGIVYEAEEHAAFE